MRAIGTNPASPEMTNGGNDDGMGTTGTGTLAAGFRSYTDVSDGLHG